MKICRILWILQEKRYISHLKIAFPAPFLTLDAVLPASCLKKAVGPAEVPVLSLEMAIQPGIVLN